MSTTTKKSALLALLRKQWVGHPLALDRCHSRTLSQRVSEFKREGWVVLDRWVRTADSKAKEYRIVKAVA